MKKNTKNVPSLSSDNLEDDVHITYHENGQKKEEETWKDGQENGLLTQWYKNGQMKEQGVYKKGVSW